MFLLLFSVIKVSETEGVSTAKVFFSRAPESGLNCRFRETKKDQNILPCVAGGKSVATTRARNILGYLQIVGN